MEYMTKSALMVAPRLKYTASMPVFTAIKDG